VERIAGEAHAVQLLPQVSARRDVAAFVVPADGYFMLGDNRDDSEDSRYIGVVPRRLLIGRVKRLVVSADIQAGWVPRMQRFGKVLD
jgi:signal peptidase I